MKTRYRYIHFTPDDDGNWQCRNNTMPAHPMATIAYYRQWRRWVFTQNDPEFVFSSDCLRDIADFLDVLKGTQ